MQVACGRGWNPRRPKQKANHLAVPSHVPSRHNCLPSTDCAPTRPPRDPPLSVTRRCHRVPAARGRAFSAAVTRGPHELRGDVLLDPEDATVVGRSPTCWPIPRCALGQKTPWKRTDIIVFYSVFSTRGALSVKTISTLMGTEWIFLFSLETQ